MVTTLIATSNLNTNYIFDGTGGEVVWLLSGVTICSAGSIVMEISGPNSEFTSDGTILAGSDFDGGLQMYGGGNALAFGSSSIYRSAMDDAVGGSFFPSMFLFGGTTALTNHGLISAARGLAIGMNAGGNSIYNDGTIEGGLGGVLLGFDGGVGDRLVNDGTITAGNTAFAGAGVRGNHAVEIEGNNTVVINHGTLAAVAAFGAGLHIGFSVDDTGVNSRIENYGTITSALWWGVDMTMLNNGGATLYNHGVITGAPGNTGSVVGSAFDDVITNSGTMQGRIDLSSGNDFYDGRGGVVFGQIAAGYGNDTMFGGAQDDNLFGDVGNDILRGGAGDDTVSGGIGKDTLFGGAGDDIIAGGKGQDVMTGGAGEDAFLFVSVAEIGKAAGQGDRIMDFTSGIDLIDLSGLNGMLSFIGATAFSHSVGQVRYAADTGLLEGDTDGNGTADFSLSLGVGTILVAADLLL